MLKFSRIEQAGRSMVEMLGVLAIIGVLSVGGISGYSKAMAKFKLTKAQDQMSMLLINIRTAYATASSYSGLETETAYQYNILPQDMVQTSSVFVNAFGGAVEIGTGSKTDAADVSRFYIKFSGLGKETCASLASSDWGTEGLAGIMVGTAGYHTPGGGGDGAKGKLPITLKDANSEGYCDTKDATNTITWYYY